MTPSGPAGTQWPFSHKNSCSLQPPTGEKEEEGVGVVSQRYPGGEGWITTFVHKNMTQQKVAMSTNHLHSPWSQDAGRCRSGSRVAADGQTELTPSCPVCSQPPLDRHGYHEKPGGKKKKSRFQELEKQCQMRLRVTHWKLYGHGVKSDLGSGPDISDKLFVSIPLSAILAEL